MVINVGPKHIQRHLTKQHLHSLLIDPETLGRVKQILVGGRLGCHRRQGLYMNFFRPPAIEALSHEMCLIFKFKQSTWHHV